MDFTEKDVRNIIHDKSKTIDGDISWTQDSDHPTWIEFKVDVKTSTDTPLMVAGSYNYDIPALSYHLAFKGLGRIYGLDYGKDHHNPSCVNTGTLHRHQWTDSFRDKEAYKPSDITAPITDIIGVWEQFCIEANINHIGKLSSPPPRLEELF